MLNRQLIMFVVMVIVGVLFNPMNILAYRFNDLYLSLTLFYGGLLMDPNNGDIYPCPRMLPTLGASINV